MIRSLLLFSAALIFFSCNSATGIKEMVSNSDSVAINFYKGDGTTDTVVRVSILRNKKEIAGLADFIESGTTKGPKCGYDGSLHFFKNDAVIKDVDFRMNDAACMHFSFVMNGKLYATKLSAAAKQFLQSVNKTSNP
jgi:hypothetical protein